MTERARSPGWGGARTNAGRPARGAIASEPHKTRPELAARHPVLVTARVGRGLGSLRRRRAYAALRRAVACSLARADFRIVRLAVRSSRLELVVEADDKVALARGMQGFQVAAARALNRARRRTGTVFPDRYRPTMLRTRRAVRAALSALPVQHWAPASAFTWLLRTTRPPVRHSREGWQPLRSARPP
ncbi:hypothetical protein BH11MYX3_BH11MYX3_23980 [soil metagenome]